jgi:hypothetical protein
MNLDREYWDISNRPEVINKEYANQKYSYLNESMNNNWRIIPNNYSDTIPLYSNYVYNNKILPKKNIHNFEWMKNTPLWEKKPNHQFKPFNRYQKEVKLGEDEYLETDINKLGEVESFKSMYQDFLKKNDTKNKLLIKGVMEDAEILSKPLANYRQYFDEYGFESYK